MMFRRDVSRTLALKGLLSQRYTSFIQQQLNCEMCRMFDKHISIFCVRCCLVVRDIFLVFFVFSLPPTHQVSYSKLHFPIMKWNCHLGKISFFYDRC